MPTLTEADTKKVLLALTLYLASLFAANTPGLKIAPFILGLHVSTVLFMVIAFYGVYPNPALFRIIISWWLFKVAMGFVYTPLSYLALKLLREKA